MSRLEVSQTTEFNVNDASSLVLSLKQLSKAKRKPIGAMPLFWSPEKKGEEKRVIFLEIAKDFEIPDYNNMKKTVQKDVVAFLEVREEKAHLLTCASTRLVSFFKSTGKKGDAYEVVFVGKLKNKTNNNLSNHFEIFPVEV